LLLAATVRSFALMPLGISDRNTPIATGLMSSESNRTNVLGFRPNQLNSQNTRPEL